MFYAYVEYIIYITDISHGVVIQSIQIEHLIESLSRFHEVVNRLFPHLTSTIPSPENINVQNLEKTNWTSDACNSAQKSRRRGNKRLVGGGHIQDFHNHLHNVYLGKATERSLGRHLTIIFQDSLDKVDTSLKVRTTHVQFVQAYNKE